MPTILPVASRAALASQTAKHTSMLAMMPGGGRGRGRREGHSGGAAGCQRSSGRQLRSQQAPALLQQPAPPLHPCTPTPRSPPPATLTPHHHGAPAQLALGLRQVHEVVVAAGPDAGAVKQAQHEQAAHQVGPPGDHQQAQPAQRADAACEGGGWGAGLGIAARGCKDWGRPPHCMLRWQAGSAVLRRPTQPTPAAHPPARRPASRSSCR